MGLFEGPRAKRAHVKDAERIAAQVRPGDTIYLVNYYDTPSGGERLFYMPHVVTKGRFSPSGNVAQMVLSNVAVRLTKPTDIPHCKDLWSY